jgi:hypothetical protein
MRLVKEENPGKSSKWLMNKHNKTFAAWLKDEYYRHPYDPNNDSEGDGELIYRLPQGSQYNVRTYRAYDINGYTLYMEAQDQRSIYQNSGVVLNVHVDNTSKTKTKYYGVIEDIWVLDYTTT